MILDRSFGARVLQSIDVYTWCMAARSILRNAPVIVEVIVELSWNAREISSPRLGDYFGCLSILMLLTPIAEVTP